MQEQGVTHRLYPSGIGAQTGSENNRARRSSQTGEPPTLVPQRKMPRSTNVGTLRRAGYIGNYARKYRISRNEAYFLVSAMQQDIVGTIYKALGCSPPK
jgi:hypothetical protein